MAGLSRSLQRVDRPRRKSVYLGHVNLFPTQGGENFSLFFPTFSQGGACRHTHAPERRLRRSSSSEEEKLAEGQSVPRRCSPDTTQQIDHRSHRGTDRPPADPAVHRRNRTSVPPPRPPFSELQVRRRVSSSAALRNARTDCCKTSGKFLTYYAKQTCALL